MYKVGILGSGSSARVHKAALERWGEELGFELVNPQIVEIREKPETAAYKTRVERSLAEIIADSKCDSVIVTWPLSLRYEAALIALQAGKHVFVDGPPSDEPEKNRELAYEAIERKQTLFVGYPLAARQRVSDLRQNLLGNMRIIEIRIELIEIGRPLDAVDFSPGALWDSGVQAVAVLAELLPNIQPQVTYAKMVVPQHIHFDTEVNADFFWAERGGGKGSLYQSWLSIETARHRRVIQLQFGSGQKVKIPLWSPDNIDPKGNNHHSMYAQFAECLNRGTIYAPQMPVRFCRDVDVMANSYHIKY